MESIHMPHFLLRQRVEQTRYAWPLVLILQRFLNVIFCVLDLVSDQFGQALDNLHLGCPHYAAEAAAAGGNTPPANVQLFGNRSTLAVAACNWSADTCAWSDSILFCAIMSFTLWI